MDIYKTLPVCQKCVFCVQSDGLATSMGFYATPCTDFLSQDTHALSGARMLKLYKTQFQTAEQYLHFLVSIIGLAVYAIF
jgi:hypothetical protein